MPRIVQISDCHLFADPAAELKGVSTRRCLERVLSALRDELPRADLLIVSGDLTHDERRETYVAFRELLADWLPRLRMLPGNHDERTLMREVFGDVVQTAGERNVFSDSLGEWRLIGLDSQITGALPGELGAEQLAWLESQLTTTSQPTAVFLHHPPISVGSAWLDRIGLVDAAALWNVVEQFPQVKLIGTGHVHQEMAVSRGSVTVVTTPSTGVQFRPETESLVVDDQPPGYRILELEKEGNFRTRVVRVISSLARRASAEAASG